MRKEFITLSITETRPDKDEFSVIAMETKSQNIISLNLKKSEIISDQGEIYWDIGFITVGDISKNSSSSNSNSTYLATNTQIGDNQISLLKNLLETKSLNPQLFFTNDKFQFGIVKVNKVIDLKIRVDKCNYTKDIIKHYITVNICGIPHYENPNEYLNKDYRWVKFWNQIHESPYYKSQKEKYLRILNQKDKNLYLILRRYYFDKKNVKIWISGMHWI